ncbi:MAG: riboflavin synthase [Lacipirellulaceae bacterium]
MFTGLVQRLATVAAVVPEGAAVRLVIDDPTVASGVAIGDSVAVNGCCLTVVSIAGPRLAFQAGSETLSRTNLGKLRVGDRVNLERSLRVGDELGGHLVTGHIDALGTVERRIDEPGPDGDQGWAKFWFRVPGPLARQLAGKGSVAVDGVSLTLVDVEDAPDGDGRFSVALIPHTLSVTTLGAREVGDEVNVETDVLAKYVARQLAALTA